MATVAPTEFYRPRREQKPMSLIKFDPKISEKMRMSIIEKLRQVEIDQDVHILFAVESGSRAWGFPSPDSDYDVRFIYAHSSDWYLSLTPGRDVIELPLDEVYDINGWDIRKALSLLLKPNPVMLEWLSSPIRYMWNDNICDALTLFSQKTAPDPACLYHYLHIGDQQWRTYIDGKDEVNLKKYFYIIRPAMALKWIREHPNIPAPMNFQALVKGCDLEASLCSALDALLLAKSKSKEIGLAPRVAVIDAFITSEFDLAREAVKTMKKDKPELLDEANILFRKIVKEIF